MRADKILTVKHLSKQFGNHRVIDDLSFDIYTNQRVALFAPSGTGKTTLINILTGLETYDSGSFNLQDSEPITIFQEPRLFPFLTIEENIFLPFKAQSKPITSTIINNYYNWLKVCGLNNCTHQFPYQLSGGMKQKVSLIRGLLDKPRFVMMDEPFQFIDQTSKWEIMEHILQECPQTAVLFVTHQAEEIPPFAHSVLYFESLCLKTTRPIDITKFQSIHANKKHFINPRTQHCAAH